MPAHQPGSIPEYIESAPAVARPHLLRIYEILRSVAPGAQETIKWGAPFFVEPRYLFSFSAQKAHCNFAPMPETLDAFRDELKGHRTTKNYLQIPYSHPVPADLVRRLAEYRLQRVQERTDDSFW